MHTHARTQVTVHKHHQPIPNFPLHWQSCFRVFAFLFISLRCHTHERLWAGVCACVAVCECGCVRVWWLCRDLYANQPSCALTYQPRQAAYLPICLSACKRRNHTATAAAVAAVAAAAVLRSQFSTSTLGTAFVAVSCVCSSSKVVQSEAEARK